MGALGGREVIIHSLQRVTGVFSPVAAEPLSQPAAASESPESAELSSPPAAAVSELPSLVSRFSESREPAPPVSSEFELFPALWVSGGTA